MNVIYFLYLFLPLSLSLALSCSISPPLPSVRVTRNCSYVAYPNMEPKCPLGVVRQPGWRWIQPVLDHVTSRVELLETCEHAVHSPWQQIHTGADVIQLLKQWGKRKDVWRDGEITEMLTACVLYRVVTMRGKEKGRELWQVSCPPAEPSFDGTHTTATTS